MVDILYIENGVAENALTSNVVSHFHKAEKVPIDRYGEVFNVKAQNFRQQKRRPALILAEKLGQRIMSTPSEYETGGDQNFYFSHMLNCVYDCRYCFLQGMYRSANYLLFVNYDDFANDLRAHVKEATAINPWYFSGYDCDSLALEPVTGFAEYFLKVFSESEMAKATLELRTKSTQIRSLLNKKSMPNVVVAFSLNPDEVINSIEVGTPSLQKRLTAIKQLQQTGWRIGLRFDPVVWHAEFQQTYEMFFKTVFSEINPVQVDSITLGGVRLPKDFHKIMTKLYPEHWLFKAGMDLTEDNMMTYTKEISSELLGFCQQQINQYADAEKVFVYTGN